jgi:hypothetical protein
MAPFDLFDYLLHLSAWVKAIGSQTHHFAKQERRQCSARTVGSREDDDAGPRFHGAMVADGPPLVNVSSSIHR